MRCRARRKAKARITVTIKIDNKEVTNYLYTAREADALLVQWNSDDPVSSKEVDRNNAVFALQHNRNPYIDHPEWVNSIWGPFASIASNAQPATVWVDNGARVHGITGSCTLTLLEMTGRVVAVRDVREDCDLGTALAPGAYLLRWNMDNGSGVVRFTR